MLDKINCWLQAGGLPFLFLLIIVEGNPLIGSFVPGQVIVIFVGFLISAINLYNLYATLIIVFIASFLGDLLGYWMGKKYGVSGLKVFKLDDKSTIYQSSYRFFKKYGSLSIILGREFNFTRAFMPFFAGCFGMRLIPFIIIALISCFLWTILSISLGYFFGFIVVENFKFIMEFILVLIIYIMFVTFVYKNVKTIYHNNFSFFRNYAIHNFIITGILFVLILIMSSILKWGYFQIINDCFVLFYFPGLYLIFGFLNSNLFLITLSVLIFLTLLIKKNYKMLSVFFWSIIFFLFYNFILILFLKKWYGIKLFYSVIYFVYLIFFSWILLKYYTHKKKHIKIIELTLICLLILMILSVYSATTNIFIIILSFLVSVVYTELIILLSHYHILDNCLSTCRYRH